MAHQQKLNRKRALVWRVVATTGLLVAAVWFLWAHRHTLSESLTVVGAADARWLATALLLMASTFFIAATTYGVLALHPLRYGQTLLVEFATAAMNRVLPAGLGGLGLNGLYLYRRGHTPAEATAVVSVNNLLGMLAHLVLLVIVLVGWPRTLFAPVSHTQLMHLWWGVVCLVVVCGGILGVSPVRKRLISFVHNLLTSIRKLPGSSVSSAFLLSMSLTATYTLILFCVAHSVDIGLSLPQVFIVFSFGMLAATATPAPGGLVGAEAGLFAGFVTYGVPSASAGAAVLLFRLATYWLPLAPGVLALLTARSRQLV